MAEDNLIQPAAGAAPQPAAPAPEPTPAPSDGAAPTKGEIPPAVAKIPAFQAILVGQPAAFSTAIKSKNPSIDAIWDAREKLKGAGIAFYRSLSGDTGVVFNALHVHPQALQEADKAGNLLSIAPPFEQIEKALLSHPASHPILNPNFKPPETPPMAPTLQPAQSASSAPPPPASVQRGLASARQKLVAPGGPTTGMSPGAGRVLNAINKPVV